MEKKEYLNRVEDLTAEEIVKGIIAGVVTFDELKKEAIRNDSYFGADKQKEIRRLLKTKDDEAFMNAWTVDALENYLLVFPQGNHVDEAREKIRQKQESEAAEQRRGQDREKMLRRIREDINEYTPDEITAKLSDEDLNDLCRQLGIEVSTVKNYRIPELKFNDIPQTVSDIPPGYTDVFFWGIPSSGKTCALSAIFNTIKKNYSMEAPDCAKKFGATYRDSLVNIFNNGFAYLPGRTNEDRTQYMPFLFYRRDEKQKRKISFFELSGEVFKYFYEEANSSRIINDDDRRDIESSFKTLDLLLKSDNQKIHFFFIDYNQETKHTIDSNGLTQSNYLEAAATYFRDRNNIFKKKTDAVYVVVTKSDEIPGNESERAKKAKDFLDDNFGSFMNVLKSQCRENSVDFKVKQFSIGDVYFKKICKINRDYSADIIEDLLRRVKPVSKNKLVRFFNN